MRARTSGFVVALALGLPSGSLAGLLALPISTEAQQGGKVVLIGFLGPSSAAGSSATIAAFRKGLRELGYLEGQNLAIEWRWAERTDQLPILARELVALKPDVLVSPDGLAVESLRIATTTIPIVSAGGISGPSWIVSLARPGGNVTGLASITGELEPKRMELLKETVPAVSRVAVFRDFSVNPSDLPANWTPSERWGLTFIPIAVRGADDLEGAFAGAVRERAGALSFASTPLFYTHRRRIADLAVKRRLAWIAGDREYAEAGGLMSYGTDRNDLVRRAATFVDKILKGVNPANLPIEQPTKFELVINLKTAKALGLTIPQSVLIRADEVIQ